MRFVPVSVLGTLLACSPAFGDELKRLQQAALSSDYALRQTDYLTNTIGPRLSGSPQAARAVEYVADEMRRLGLEVTLEKTKVPHWVRGTETGELMEFPQRAPDVTQKIILTALGGSVATPTTGITAPVVVVSDFDELKTLGETNIKGKIVVFNYKFDAALAAKDRAIEAYKKAVTYRLNGASSAARYGAVAALNRSVGPEVYRLPHTGSLLYADDAPRIPAAAVTAEDADLIARLAKGGNVKLKLVLTPQTLPDTDSYNVIADLKGTQHPEQIVLVSGHLDSWDLGTGALDDAVGVAMAMEVGHLCQKLGLRPKRTIRIVAWMNEENGRRGSLTYFENHKNELAQHVAAIESDLGAGKPRGLLARVPLNFLTKLRPITSVLKSQGAGDIQVVPSTDGTDIEVLEEAGIPGFAPLRDSRTYFHYHHTAADTFDKVDPKLLAENAALMAVLSYGLSTF